MARYSGRKYDTYRALTVNTMHRTVSMGENVYYFLYPDDTNKILSMLFDSVILPAGSLPPNEKLLEAALLRTRMQ
jgi:hypothetical protein